jgi:hypothetical protein
MRDTVFNPEDQVDAAKVNDRPLVSDIRTVVYAV